MTVSPAPTAVFRYFGHTDLANENREFIRAAGIMCQLTRNFHEWQLPIEACLQEVYGEAGSRRFWEIECFQPASLARFVELLTVMLEPEECSNSGRPDLEMRGRDVAIRAALITAYQADPANRSIFAGDLSSLETAQYGHQLQSALKVHVKPAAECLLRMPKLSHLLPASLSGFLANQDVACQASPSYAKANDELIVEALRHAYSEGDGPNLKIAYERARDWLHGEGYHAIKERIQTLADQDEFAKQRGQSGVRKSARTDKK